MNVIKDYEVMFTTRTGVTVLVPKDAVFDGGIEAPPTFSRSAENPQDLVVKGAGQLVLTGMKKDYLDEAIARGFIMFYETVDDEVVRCTACHYLK